jgi:hypothetical protein
MLFMPLNRSKSTFRCVLLEVVIVQLLHAWLYARVCFGGNVGFVYVRSMIRIRATGYGTVEKYNEAEYYAFFGPAY